MLPPAKRLARGALDAIAHRGAQGYAPRHGDAESGITEAVGSDCGGEHPAANAAGATQYRAKFLRTKQASRLWKSRARAGQWVCGSNGKARASLGAPRGQDGASAAGVHARAKSVGALAFYLARLIGTFHGIAAWFLKKLKMPLRFAAGGRWAKKGRIVNSVWARKSTFPTGGARACGPYARKRRRRRTQTEIVWLGAVLEVN